MGLFLRGYVHFAVVVRLVWAMCENMLPVLFERQCHGQPSNFIGLKCAMLMLWFWCMCFGGSCA